MDKLGVLIVVLGLVTVVTASITFHIKRNQMAERGSSDAGDYILLAFALIMAIMGALLAIGILVI